MPHSLHSRFSFPPAVQFLKSKEGVSLFPDGMKRRKARKEHQSPEKSHS